MLLLPCSRADILGLQEIYDDSVCFYLAQTEIKSLLWLIPDTFFLKKERGQFGQVALGTGTSTQDWWAILLVLVFPRQCLESSEYQLGSCSWLGCLGRSCRWSIGIIACRRWALILPPAKLLSTGMPVVPGAGLGWNVLLWERAVRV